MTSEHAFPDWLRLMFVTTPDEPMTASIQSRGLRTRDKFWASNSATVTTNTVCEPCNTGWMRQLEDMVIPILKPMLLREQVELAQEDCVLLTTWAVKTSIVFQSMSPQTAAISAGQRAAFAGPLRQLPIGTHARLAAYEGVARLLHWYQAGTSTLDETAAPDTYCSTFILGPVVLQLVGVPARGDGALKTIASPDAMYVPTFPPSPPRAVWPPRVVLDDEGVANLMNSFAIDRGPGFPRLAPMGRPEPSS